LSWSANSMSTNACGITPTVFPPASRAPLETAPIIEICPPPVMSSLEAVAIPCPS
jgi:hypothetical protein